MVICNFNIDILIKVGDFNGLIDNFYYVNDVVKFGFICKEGECVIYIILIFLLLY